MRIKYGIILFCVFFVITALLLLTPNSAYAAPLNNFPVTITQPDGTELNLLSSGDEFYNWLLDAQGYTIIQDPDNGYYVYADLVNGELVPTDFVAGKVDPASVGLRPYINISPEQKGEIRQAFLDQTKQTVAEVANAPTTGTINNLVVFIRFSGESEFTDLTSKYTGLLNDPTTGANSLRNYYREVSYNALTINSFLFPSPGTTAVSYQDSHTRGYFQPYNVVTNPGGYTGGDSGTNRRVREHTLLRDAINYVSGLGQFPSGESIDADGDGLVDSLTFIVSGSPTGWNSLLWPHQWNLTTYTVTINGKTVDGYSFQMNSSLQTGVLTHEMFHVLGSPDLYHYSYDGLQPVGGWDVMEIDSDPPEHMGCYMKFRYGNWISSIPELTSPGTYTLNPLTSSTNNCYKIVSPYSATEYFVVEYRNGAGSTFESSLPGTGLLVYRINTNRDGLGNADGPPDEVYIYRPGGTTSVNGSVNTAHYSSNVGRTAINDSTNPSSFLSNGSAGGLNICYVGTSNATISFDICTGSVFAISGNAGVGGATLSYTDGTSKTTTANGSGLYSFVVPSGWSGTVTPSKTGYTFVPVSRSYTNVLANQTAQNYTATGPTNLLIDPGFEAFTPNPYWVETSTNFGTPLCTVAVCGTGGGTAGPQMGSVWGWFGGTEDSETSSLSQIVTIPNGSFSLEFYLWIGAAGAGSDAADVFAAKIDGVTVFSANATQINSYSAYTLVSVDVSAYANNAAHTVMFSSVTTGQQVNFNLDDVALLRTSPRYTISGNAGVGMAILSYTDITSKTVTADGSGLYSFTLPSGWSGTVTPSKTGYSFLPVNRTYTNILENQTGQNYTASLNTIQLNVNKTGTGIGTVTSSPAGIDCGVTCSASFNYNTDVTLTATASTGSAFTGWSGACTGTGTCTVIIDAAKSVIANFTMNTFALNVSKSGTGSGTATSNPAGINCGSTCFYSFDYNTVVTLTAIAATGSTFTGWSGACTGMGTCMVTIDAAKSVTVNFTLNTYRFYLPMVIR